MLSEAKRWYLHRHEELCNQKTNDDQEVFLNTFNPEKWLGQSFAAIEAKRRIWFIPPTWQDTELQQTKDIISPSIIWNDNDAVEKKQFHNSNNQLNSNNASPTGIMIATGGSSGDIKFAWHTVETLDAAVSAMCKFFLNRQIKTNDFCYNCDLPLWHISGWMQAYRAFRSNSMFNIEGVKNQNTEITDPNTTRWISLVPTQFHRLLNTPDKKKLHDYDFIILGGGPVSKSLLEEALQNKIQPWLTYGMTETAGMIAGKQIKNTGDIEKAALIFPHTKIKTKPQPQGEIMINCKSLCIGYNNQAFTEDRRKLFSTHDFGEITKEGKLHIHGRVDSIINSGGEKILPFEIEEAVRQYPNVKNCMVKGLPSQEWGTVCVCLIEPSQKGRIDIKKIRSFLKERISSYKIPKKWGFVEKIPYDKKGKIIKIQLDELMKKTDFHS